MIKAIIFDCFGVVRVDALQTAYEALGGDFAADRDFIVSTVDSASKGTIPSSLPVIAENLGVSVDVWQQALTSGSTLNQPVLDYAKELRNSYKTAMLTNIGTGGVERMFEPGFLDAYFDVVVASGDIGFAKPEPQAYEITAERLEVRLDECVFIDDRPEYVEGARAVGMQAVVFIATEKLKKDLAKILN